MNKKLATIDAYDGLRKADKIMDDKKVRALPVIKEGKLIGILTSRDMRKANPNRIAADAMSECIITAKPDTSIWEAKAMLEKYSLEELVVTKNEELLGIVENTRLYEEIGKHVDLLTELHKGDYLYYRGTELLEKGIEIAVLFIDLDKFGQVDKQYGHIVGDNILKEIGNILKSNIEHDSYVCRFGGDEFIVLAPYKLEGCKALAEKLLKEIASHSFVNDIVITASIGIAGGRRNEARKNEAVEVISDLINLASLASTKAKKQIDKLAVAEGFCASETA